MQKNENTKVGVKRRMAKIIYTELKKDCGDALITSVKKVTQNSIIGIDSDNR